MLHVQSSYAILNRQIPLYDEGGCKHPLREQRSSALRELGECGVKTDHFEMHSLSN